MTSDVLTAPPPHPEQTADHVDQGRLFAYRPALDGIRAIAVIGVLLYHGALFTRDPVSVLPGGFLGVDLFFVLSGFLITTLLVTEWQHSGTIRFGAFWGRRFRRLMPALLLVVAFVAVAYLVVEFNGSQVANARRDTLGTLGYVYNWVAALSGQSYFEAFDGASPLRHMWSLAIEEQFYVLWPLALFALLKRLRLPLQTVALVTLAGAVASALLMVLLYVPGEDPSRIYYGTDTRAQAMLIGAFLGLAVLARPTVKLGTTAMQALGVGGLLGCIAMFVIATDDVSQSGWMYQGGFLLMAVMAGCAVLVASGPQTTPYATALSWRPLVWVGTISYGLYLWHWPVFVVLDSDRTGLGGFELLVLRLATTVVLSAFSYTLVEAPIRFGALRERRRRPVFAALGAAVLGLILLGLVVVVPTDQQRLVAEAGASESQARVPGSEPGDLKVLMVGDSTALTLAVNRPKNADPGIVVMTDANLGCSVSAGDAVMAGRSAVCASQRTRWADDVARFDPDVVVLMFGPWEVYNREVDGKNLVSGTPEFNAAKAAALEQSLDVLGAKGAHVLAMTSPCFKMLRSGLIPKSQSVFLEDGRRVDNYNAVLKTFAGKHRDRVTIADLHELVCPGGRFTGSVAGTAYTTDGVHVNAAGAVVVWRWLDPQIRAASRPK